jgi:putative addiction module component (TIGR02574 family)
MTDRGEELLTQALTLSESDRVNLAERLLESVAPAESPTRLDETRVREIILECRRRMEAYQRGDTGAKSIAEVFPELSADVVS